MSFLVLQTSYVQSADDSQSQLNGGSNIFLKLDNFNSTISCIINAMKCRRAVQVICGSI